MSDTTDPQTDAGDEYAMKDDALGGLATEEASSQVPRDGGDNADATRDGGPDPESPSRTGAGSVPHPARDNEVDADA